MTTKRFSREQRLAQVRDWLGSGLSCKGFARRAGIKPNTLAWWKWKLESEGVWLTPRRPRPESSQKEPSVSFVEITPAPGRDMPPPRIELELAGATLRVPEGFDDQTLARVVHVLRGSR